ncbi:MAG TPA: nitroreductase family protein [Methylomusa anaerophila]|uniref:NADH dehydrogenase n=1 Tax=Methylomusa anaerophila TaxID=1930071 RepID=A0A348AG42_9FIRM|nr:nitroreductase family protein [Methylomusa anaerophila]BBB90040.1 NADH dehydrogenase [Methylomusa anaerophila]HML88233.1 nitroreductase family protein [Methylomusa anaerophila]
MKELEFIYKRVSVRKFKEDPIPVEHIREIVKAATYAPSGKNLQNWHFVVVKNKNKIAEIASIVEQKNQKLTNYIKDADKIKAFAGSVRYHTVFQTAPVLILVYAGPYDTIADTLLEAGILPREEALSYAKPNPGIQNIAAALENLLLAAASLGYGACWMTGPSYAAAEISQYIGFKKEGYYLAAMTPLGIPASGEIANPARKPLEEVLTIIE